MTRFVSLLRAVNLGSHNKLRMPDLVKCYESLGLRNVQSYIQSGNVVFNADGQDRSDIEQEIEAAIAKAFGVGTPVMVRTSKEMTAVVANNPFPPSYAEKLAVAFLSSPSERPNLEAIERSIGPGEQIKLAGAEAYLYYPNGQGRSKMTNTLLERRLGVTATVRNWRTVNKLLEMASE